MERDIIRMLVEEVLDKEEALDCLREAIKERLDYEELADHILEYYNINAIAAEALADPPF